MSSVKATEYNSIVSVIPKEDLVGLVPAKPFLYENINDLKAHFYDGPDVTFLYI